MSDAEFVVMRASDSDTTLTAGGVETIELTSDAPRLEIGDDSLGEALMGKRYVDELDGFEVLCTKPGVGGLAIDGRPLLLKSPKPLPSSD